MSIATKKEAPLEDLMVAMDVVDTLRHRQQLVDRELDADARRERLIEKLRNIYESQGIEVTDQVLADGVRALEEERFTYKPPKRTFMTHFAELYSNRGRWLKPFLYLLGLFFGIWLLLYVLLIRPDKVAQADLPSDLNQRYSEIVQIANTDAIESQARQLEQIGLVAAENNNFDEASTALENLDAMLVNLKLEYLLRVIQRPRESSGVWRIPEANESARNFYLIIEAIDASGSTLTLPITNEETGETELVDKWGIRVDESIFQRIASDKSDDGIIQNRNVGQKQRGYIQPNYSVETSGAMITEW